MSYTRTIIAAVAGIVLLPGVSPARAQGPELTVAVPFEFSIGHTTLPRGTYEVVPVGSMQDMLQLRDGHHSAFVIGTASSNLNHRDIQPSLVFDRYGDQYFLRDIRFAENVEFSLPETREERQAIRQRAELSRPESRQVVVAAELR